MAERGIGQAGAGLSALEAHARECDECRAAPPALGEIATALSGVAVYVDPPRLSQQAMTRVAAEMARRAAAAFRRQVAITVLLALVPLPLVAVYSAYLLRLIYSLGAVLLPVGVVTYFVLGYAALLVLLFALTYAAIPVLLDRVTMSRPVAPA